jgi:hypothetical protein
MKLPVSVVGALKLATIGVGPIHSQPNKRRWRRIHLKGAPLAWCLPSRSIATAQKTAHDATSARIQRRIDRGFAGVPTIRNPSPVFRCVRNANSRRKFSRSFFEKQPQRAERLGVTLPNKRKSPTSGYCISKRKK